MALLVKTRLGPSKIHGLGVFADELIRKGTTVWRWAPGFDIRISIWDLDALPEPVRTYVREYGYRETVSPLQLVLDGDNGRFMNHSGSPSIAFDVAQRDLHPGDELTCDYREFDLDSRLKPPTYIEP